MTDSEKLDLILSEVKELKQRTENIEQRTENIEQRTENIEQRTTEIELTLENETNHNIQLLAENHITLIDKLNQSIKVADKTLMYEVQMTSLKSRIDLLEKEMIVIKNQMA